MFSRLDYPIGLKNFQIVPIGTKPEKGTDDSETIRMVLPFKDQMAGNVRRQLRDLSNKLAVSLQLEEFLCDVGYVPIILTLLPESRCISDIWPYDNTNKKSNNSNNNLLRGFHYMA